MAKKLCRIFLVRHGESEANRDDIISGHFDTPLTDTGRLQARATARALSDISFDAVYSSDLQRARETAEIICGQQLATANQIFDLRERDWGPLDKKPGEHYRQLHKEHDKKYAHLSNKQKWEIAYAEGIESDHLLAMRVLGALRVIAQNHPNQTLLVVAHGGSIRTALNKLGIEEIKPGSFRNAGYIELTFDGVNFKVVDISGIAKE